LLEATGSIVGAMLEMEYHQAALRLEPGAALVLFTDGVMEARSPGGRMLGVEGIRAVVQECARQSADQIAAAVLEAARRLAGGPLRDDAAVVVIRNGG
jgi:sigma-B regulation protein RsbU (phosphoserine phosphatase)